MSSLAALLIVVSVSMLARAEKAPALVIRPPSYTIGVQNERVRMTCVAYGMPLPKITWTRNDSAPVDATIITEKNLTVNGTTFSVSILEFCAASASHIAWYNCTASNGVNGSGIAESTAQFYLHIMEAAKEAPNMVTHPTDPTNAVSGETVELVCTAYGRPLPDVSWHGRRSSEREYTAYTDAQIVDDTTIIAGKMFRKSTLKLPSINEDTWITCNSSNGIAGNGTNFPNASFFLNVVQGSMSSAVAGGSSSTAALGAVVGVEAAVIILMFIIIIIIVLVIKQRKKKQTHINSSHTVTNKATDEDHYTSLSELGGAIQKGALNEKDTCINEVYDEVKEVPTDDVRGVPKAGTDKEYM